VVFSVFLEYRIAANSVHCDSAIGFVYGSAGLLKSTGSSALTAPLFKDGRVAPAADARVLLLKPLTPQALLGRGMRPLKWMRTLSQKQYLEVAAAEQAAAGAPIVL
jgi:hypothetical protein